MVLRLAPASEEDAARIADIHMAAFATNKNLLAQFPSRQARDGLRRTVAQKTLDDIRDPNMVVHLIRDTELNNETISFARWNLPSSTDENEAPWMWPEGTRMDLLETWSQRVEETKDDIVGDQVCYRLAYVATHPDHERRGAATMLIKWAIDKCKEEKIPAYLESTPMASALYRRLGFGPGKRFHITFEDGSTYEEEGYLFQPDEVSI